MHMDSNPDRNAGFSYVNRAHHTSCFTGSCSADMTLHLPKASPDPYAVPKTAKAVIEAKKGRMSTNSALIICQSARVYCNSDHIKATQRTIGKRWQEVHSPRKMVSADKSLKDMHTSTPRRLRDQRTFSKSSDTRQTKVENVKENTAKGTSPDSTSLERRHFQEDPSSELTSELTSTSPALRRRYVSDDDYDDDDDDDDDNNNNNN